MLEILNIFFPSKNEIPKTKNIFGSKDEDSISISVKTKKFPIEHFLQFLKGFQRM